MNLALPVVSVTLGPEWANEVNAALEVIDQHDHSSGKGVQITPSGMNITSNLDFKNNAAINLLKAGLQAQLSALSGASNSNSLYSVNGNLFFTNGSGVAVQLTTGGAIVTAPSSTNLFQFDGLSTNLTIVPADNFVVLAVDTTAARSITLPLAANVSAGRIYIIKDASGQSETNAISLIASGSDTIDGAASIDIESNFSSTLVVCNGADEYYII